MLRQWKISDLEPFAQLNADPEVMEYFPRLKTKEESYKAAAFMSDHIEKHGWGCWAVGLKENDEFIGFIGLEAVDFETKFTPAIEIGWRIASKYWGKGYATEGALCALRYGFETLKLEEIVSFTAEGNKRSRALMERIGMYRDSKDDFDHPKLPENHPLSRHVLYRLKN